MRLLLKYGADGTISNIHGVTPLMVACGLDYYEGETPGPYTGVSEAERLEAVKLALEIGKIWKRKPTSASMKWSAAPSSSLKTYPENLDKLVDLGIGDPRFNKMRAIHGAIISNQPSILQYLIDQGAELSPKNQLGWTPS